MTSEDVLKTRSEKLTSRDRLILVGLIAIATGIVSFYLSQLHGGGVGELRYTLL